MSLVSYGSGEFEEQATEEEQESSDSKSQRSQALIRVKKEFYESVDVET